MSHVLEFSELHHPLRAATYDCLLESKAVVITEGVILSSSRQPGTVPLIQIAQVF